MDRELIKIDQTPAIVVYFDNFYYLYDGDKLSASAFLAFMNKIINPLAALTSEK
mgnify:CR=1 FL=1